MKKEDIPQDDSALQVLTKEVCYAVDGSGKYVTQLSTGWEVKVAALGITWEDIEKRIEEARKKVLNNEASPVLYFMELKLMDAAIVAAYTGFWKWQIKRHLRPDVFKGLSEKKLKKYADLFEVSINGLKKMEINEG